MGSGRPHSRQAKQILSFPRSAWECIWDALRPLCSYLGRPIQRTQSVQDAFPRRAWEREGLLNLTAMMPMLTGTPKNRSDHFLTDAIELLFYLRDHAGLKKKPATGELLVWLQSLMEISGKDHPILDDLESLLSSLSALIKTKDDLKTAEGAVQQWQPSRLA